ncbi:uncharacterized protein B0H64DRAFT_328010 [Chaetomium fimeti]|uniref:SET domain-containing protein n=1 Tax=Chaetomium fimeti TaxID=1854472 RepID=A0AAE0LPI3_9PEZI|nr:hypothetical protein B0H64DRAFT_328010 [Chaetomium fimeti]
MCYEWKNRFACGHVGFHKVERCHSLGSGCFGPDGSERFLDVDGLCYDCTARLQDPEPTAGEGDPFREGTDMVGGGGGGDSGDRGAGGGGGGRKRNAPTESSPRTTRSSTRAAGQSTARRTAAGRDAAVPDIYRQMVTEARAEINSQGSGISERPLKRRRPGEGRPTRTETPKNKAAKDISNELSKVVVGDASDDDLFGDVALPTPTVQTMTRDSDEEDDDDIDFEDVAIEAAGSSVAAAGKGSQELSLDLSAHMAALAPRRADRRKAISREEKERRVDIHKAHLVCLLAHVELRNRWCNDRGVQDALRPLIPQKTVSALIPRASLNQFGRSESLRKGLQEAKELFKLRFTIIERGLRRALWAEDEEQLKDYQLPDDMESTLEKSDFLEAARTLRGSRDVGTQLFCSLLRSVGVEARLVCSLQPLSFVPGAPPMPKQRRSQAQTPQKQPSKFDMYAAAVAKHETKYPDFQAGATTPSPRRRLGHPHAAAYQPPSITPPSQPPIPSTSQLPRVIRGESPFPVYWVEVLDVAHQSWHPVDPLVTGTQWKPRALEPPASDTLNTLTYAIAFEADASARDVTRRYAKAYTSKTRRQRIDGLPTPTNPPPPPPPDPSNPNPHPLPGQRWLRLALKRYTRPHPTDLDQIERHELSAAEAREPMPRNVADFKDHPVYALARHLRRGEALVPGAQASGTVSAGAKAPLERIYRRADVRVVRSRERWYRLGRVVRDGEEAVKSWVRPRRRRGRGVRGGSEGSEGEDDDEDPDRVGLFGDAARGYTPLYMMEQTDAYEAPPVVGGRVPKNKFGNLDLYVPSMVPRGGVHVRHQRAAHAAFILGVDYAPALTGFEFRGRHGTAVLNGVVVPEEAGEGVWAVIGGLEDMEAEEEEERRSRRALRMWSRFLKGLRIRERIWAGVDEEAEEAGGAEDKGKGREVEVDEDVGMEDVSEEEMGGGGFFVPDEDDDGDDDGGGGGFITGKMGGKPPSQPTATPLPINWPPHIPYLATPSYSPHLTPAHLRALGTRPADPSDPLPEIPRDLKPGPCPSVRITPITDPTHPAHGQAGLFATRELAPGTLILPYLGEVHVGTAPFGRPPNASGSSSDHDGYDYAGSDYDLWLDRDADLAVDAARAGNEARFVNDYRGVPGRAGRKANAEFRVVWDGRRGERCMAVFVLPAGKRATGRARVVGVARGEEVLVSYGRGFWQGRREEEAGGDGDGEWEGSKA